MKNVIIQKDKVGNIPLLISKIDSYTVYKGLVIVYHPFLKAKENMLPYTYVMAESGFIAAAIDMQRHGERDNYEEKFPWQEFYNTAFETADEITDIIDYFLENYTFEHSEVTVTGVSLGGIAALSASMLDERIKNIALIVSSGNFSALARVRKRSVLRRFYTDNQCDETKFLADVDNNAKKYDPYLAPQKMRGKKLLMINGAFDFAFPPQIVKDCQGKIMEVKQDEEWMLEFIEMKNTGHEVNNKMISVLFNWINHLF